MTGPQRTQKSSTTPQTPYTNSGPGNHQFFSPSFADVDADEDKSPTGSLITTPSPSPRILPLLQHEPSPTPSPIMANSPGDDIMVDELEQPTPEQGIRGSMHAPDAIDQIELNMDTLQHTASHSPSGTPSLYIHPPTTTNVPQPNCMVTSTHPNHCNPNPPLTDKAQTREFHAVSRSNRNAMAQCLPPNLSHAHGSKFTGAPENGFPTIELLSATELIENLDHNLLEKWFQMNEPKFLVCPFAWSGENPTKEAPILAGKIRSTVTEIAVAAKHLDTQVHVSPPSPPPPSHQTPPKRLLNLQHPTCRCRNHLARADMVNTNHHLRSEAPNGHNPAGAPALPGRLHNPRRECSP